MYTINVLHFYQFIWTAWSIVSPFICVSMHVCVCVCVCVCAYVRVCVWVCVTGYAGMCTCLNITYMSMWFICDTCECVHECMISVCMTLVFDAHVCMCTNVSACPCLLCACDMCMCGFACVCVWIIHLLHALIHACTLIHTDTHNHLLVLTVNDQLFQLHKLRGGVIQHSNVTTQRLILALHTTPGRPVSTLTNTDHISYQLHHNNIIVCTLFQKLNCTLCQIKMKS